MTKASTAWRFRQTELCWRVQDWTGSWDAAVKLWDPKTGHETGALRHEEGWVLALAFSPKGNLLASAGSDGMVRIWDVASRTLLQSPRQHGWFARAVAFSPDGKLL